MTWSSKSTLQSVQTLLGVFIYTFSTRSKPQVEKLEQIPCWLALAPISLGPSAQFLPGFPGHLGGPPAPGRLPGCREGGLEAGGKCQPHTGSWIMSTSFTAYPFLTPVNSNKNVSKQGEFSVFIAAIEKIM